MPSKESAKGLGPALTLAHQILHLTLQLPDDVLGALNRGHKFAPFPLPSVNALLLLGATPLLCIDFVTNPAFLAVRHCAHNKLHTARFTCAILSVAMLPEMAPFPIATSETMLVKETHVVPVSVVMS